MAALRRQVPHAPLIRRALEPKHQGMRKRHEGDHDQEEVMRDRDQEDQDQRSGGREEEEEESMKKGEDMRRRKGSD